MFESPILRFFNTVGKSIRLCFIKRNIMIVVVVFALLINLFLLFKGYQTNKQQQEALKIENVSNVIYILEHFSSAYSVLPGGYQQFVDITQTLTDYSKLPITISLSPSYPILEGLDLKICTTQPQLSSSPMIKDITKVLEHYHISKKGGVSFYMGCVKQWVNIKLPTTTAFILLGSSLGIQAIITIIFIWYILSIYNLHKPWNRIQDSFDSLGIKTKRIVLPSFGPNIVRYIAQLMNALVDRVETLLKERTLTIAALSHDIRTPLAKLRLHTELSEDINLQNKMLPQIDQIDTYLTIVLDYAKESYQSEKKCPIDMMALLEAVAYDYIDTGLPIGVNLAPNKVILFGQPNSLQRALMNLIDNAIKYSKKVYLDASYQIGVGLIIHVSDDGPGLPEAELERVFQPFYRNANAPTEQAVGSGLGLAIVKNIISYNEGHIYLKNREKGGLQAIVTFYDNLIYPLPQKTSR